MREKWGKMGKIADPESPNIHYLYKILAKYFENE